MKRRLITGSEKSFQTRKKKDDEAGKTRVFIDETGFSERPVKTGTWAKRGKTPILRETFNWKSMSAIVALSTSLKLLFRLHSGSIKSAEVIDFLRVLLERIEGEIVVYWDGAPTHRSRVVKEFLEQPEVAARLEVRRLPAYAPELNPDEWVFAHVKKNKLANYCTKSIGALKDKVRRTFRSLSRKKEMLRNFLLASELPIEAGRLCLVN